MTFSVISGTKARSSVVWSCISDDEQNTLLPSAIASQQHTRLHGSEHSRIKANPPFARLNTPMKDLTRQTDVRLNG